MVIIVNSNPPKPSIDYQNNELTTDGNGKLQWHNDSGSISGESSSALKPIINGEYFVTIENEFGCINYSDTISINNVGLQTEGQQTICVYPNPLTVTSVIEFPNPNHVPYEFILSDFLSLFI